MSRESDDIRNTCFRRSWDVLRLIAGSRYGLTVAQIVDEIGCSDRTIRRDLQALQDIDVGVEVVQGRRSSVCRYRCPNYLVLAPNAPRAKYCRGCGEEIPPTDTVCSDACQTVIAERERAKAIVAGDPGLRERLEADDPPVPRGSWKHEIGRDWLGRPAKNAD